MPIHLVSTGLSKVVALETYPVVLAAVFAIVFLKQWSAGLDLLGRLDRKVSEAQEAPIGNDEKGNVLVKRRRLKSRDLHGSVFLIVGGFTSQGLLVCAQLSSLGAQLILLTPTIRSSRIIQMVHLLRDGTSNPLIYAEECDITSLASVEAFAEKWNQGQGNSGEVGGLGAGPAGDLSASTGVGGTRSRGSADQTSSSPRRIDTIIFMPLDSTHYSIGDRLRKTTEGLECSHAELLGRVHLLHKMLPTLMLAPSYKDIRIISLVSPWYAAGLASYKKKKTDPAELIFRSRSPWTVEGAQTLLWLSLSRELQNRIQAMTDVDSRPRTKLPGIDDQGKVNTNKITNVNVINVCAGFERGRNVIDYLLPSSTSRQHVDEWGEEITSKEDEVNTPTSTTAPESEELRRLVNLGSRKAKSGKESNERIKQELYQQLPSSTWWSMPVHLLQYSIVTLLWPLAWLLCKSPKRTAETVTWAAVVPIFDGSQSSHLDEVGLFAVPGEMHREGRLVRPMLPDALLPGPSSAALWKSEVDRIKAVLK